MEKKKNIFKNLGLVNGTNSMTPKQVEQLGTVLPDIESIKVLEFGSGATSTILFNALKTKYENVTYVTYETNEKYAPITEGITVRMHTKDDLINLNISIPKTEKYDLIIVDGPDGELRKFWYPLFVDNVKEDTIIHIDDAFHYPSFKTEFEINFPMSEELFVVPLGEGGGKKCWITSKIKN